MNEKSSPESLSEPNTFETNASVCLSYPIDEMRVFEFLNSFRFIFFSSILDSTFLYISSKIPFGIDSCDRTINATLDLSNIIFNLNTIDYNSQTIDKILNYNSLNTTDYNSQTIDKTDNNISVNTTDYLNYVIDRSSNNATINLLDHFIPQIDKSITNISLNTVDYLTFVPDTSTNQENLLNLGIIGIKFGQFLYTRKDILNEKSSDGLEPLLSNNSIHSEEDTRKMLNYDKTNYRINNIHHIEKECIGSGSLAQVHICYLKNNPKKKYVLKVAHPCIFELENEVKMLKSVLNIFGKFKKINIDWDTFFKNITVQTDLNNEANNMKKFSDIYKNYEKIDIPELIYNDKYH